ncbi:MAG TPA: hypothetical protein VFA84_03070 [Acidimicrobiales bacterium]|nr:hypothetical protein [Acidimicrobiales bacterium]
MGAAAFRVVHARTPIRICDNGGWTDTWFAGHGKVFNIGVSPYVEVQARAFREGELPARVVIDAENYGDRYGFDPGDLPGRHPLIEAAVDETGVPDGTSVEVTIFSSAPAGCSTGTSASVTVALIGALSALNGRAMAPHEAAYAAYRVEAGRLQAQTGIQDQLCAAYGGLNYIEVTSFPDATVTPLHVPDALSWELERRLVLVFLGRPHVSSAVHDRVIAGLQGQSRVLDELRQAAEDARDAVLAADLPALGRAMTRNAEAQRRLHPSLVSADAQHAIDIATAHGALGCKVNGAGGEGGSITVLCGRDSTRPLRRAIEGADPRFRVVPTSLSRDGLRVWDA